MYELFDIDKKIVNMANEVEEEIQPIFDKLDENCLYFSEKVLKAFQDNNVSTQDFIEVTGYGYTDAGREKLEKIYAQIFSAEDALVRPQIMSGTHALKLALFGLLKHGDTFISISGKPYDTMQSVIGTSGDSNNSLIKHGINYEEIDLIDDDFDYDTIRDRVSQGNVKMVEIQRSIGYSHRSSIVMDKIEKVISVVKKADPKCIVMVDNCYGEFTERKDPCEVGADVVISSLMKNLGAGIATSGGYILGKKEYINDIAEELTAPTIGKDLGANFNQLLSYYKGLFLAPKTVCSALKSMVFASRMLEKYGYEVHPKYDETRTDIIQTVELKDRDNLIKFCQGIQMGSPIEAYVVPVPAETPGYADEEIMAGGSFTPGSTIELSCDAPLVEPYTAYMQGGLSYEYGKLGVLIALNNMLK